MTELKAAVVSSFAPFIEWPPDAIAPAAPLLVCVVNDTAVATAIERTAQERVGGHPVTVKSLSNDAPATACQVMYVAGPNPRRSLDPIAAAGSHVFTIGDAPDFTSAGGMVRLFRRDDRLRFEVNVDAVQRAGLKLSARVLALADVVRDAAPPGSSQKRNPPH